MVLVISQETFNEAVKENIDILGMAPEEALEETVKQFESQGADLTRIIKELMASPETSKEVHEIVDGLKNLNKTNCPVSKLTEQLEKIKIECEKGIQYKVFAGKAGAYDAILDTLSKSNDPQLVGDCLKTIISLVTKQPDLLDDRGIELMFQYLQKDVIPDHKKLTLKWAKECCVLHEMNRQKLMEHNMIEVIKETMTTKYPDVLREMLGLCRALVLDDDVRVEFGKAHENARIIASETLCLLTGLLNDFSRNEQVMHDLMLTLSALMVRAEFCKKVDDAGGLQLINDTMRAFPANEKITKQCFKLLKALTGDDACKAHIIQKNMAPIIGAALLKHKDNAATATCGLSCVAALALRNPDNSKALFEANLAEVIIAVMRSHPTDKNIQRTGSWAIRNMVSRSKYQCPTFLKLGAEELLRTALKEFKAIEYDIKAALRDLGCNVQLNEEWTGKGGLLHSDAKQ